jgi:anti-sigma-K factor RskA
MTEDDDIDGLAAEYVLGSLDPAERRQVDAGRRMRRWPRPSPPGSDVLRR